MIRMTDPVSKPLLEVRELTKRFGGIAAVSDLSLTVAQGEILALMGPNGAGKTTTFNLIAGTLTPTSGTIIFDGPTSSPTSGARQAWPGHFKLPSRSMS